MTKFNFGQWDFLRLISILLPGGMAAADRQSARKAFDTAKK
jgi:hypothetical protein